MVLVSWLIMQGIAARINVKSEVVNILYYYY